MGIIKYAIDKMIMIPKLIEEKFSDDNARFLKMDRSLQFDGYSCGVQCTYSILKYYRKESPIAKIDDELNAYKRSYASEASIYKLFRKRGLKVSVKLIATIKTIKEVINYYKAPMLSTIDNEEHWIVIYGYSRNYIYVLDSVFLRPFVKWRKDKFKTRWDNWVAVIKPLR